MSNDPIKTKWWFDLSIILAIIGFLVPSLFWYIIEVKGDQGWDFISRNPFILQIIYIIQAFPALFFILLYRERKQS